MVFMQFYNANTGFGGDNYHVPLTCQFALLFFKDKLGLGNGLTVSNIFWSSVVDNFQIIPIGEQQESS